MKPHVRLCPKCVKLVTSGLWSEPNLYKYLECELGNSLNHSAFSKALSSLHWIQTFSLISLLEISLTSAHDRRFPKLGISFKWHSFQCFEIKKNSNVFLVLLLFRTIHHSYSNQCSLKNSKPETFVSGQDPHRQWKYRIPVNLTWPLYQLSCLMLVEY